MRISMFLGLLLLLLLSTGSSAQLRNLEAAPGVEKLQPELLEQMLANRSVTRQSGTKMYRIIINLQAPQGTADRSADDRARLQQRVRAAQDAVVQMRRLGTFTLLNRYRNIFGFSALADEEAILELAAMGHVAFIEAVPTMHKMDTQSHPLTRIDAVHTGGFTGKDVTIAIIDDGIDAAHPAFGGDPAWPNAKIIAGHDFADNDTDPRNDCAQQSHGTAVAGVAAGNGAGVLGTAPDANLVFLKVQSAQWCGNNLLDGDLVGALDWVVSHREQYGIDMISMSLGGRTFSNATVCDNASPAMRQLINMAHAAGVVIFAASGNEAQSSAIAQPACMSNIISVGAVYDANIGPANFSICADRETGPDHVTCYSNSADFLDIVAPAHCATTASTSTGTGRQSCFGGTSSATPFAAGVAATLLEAARTPLNHDTMRRLLVETGVAVFDPKSGLFTPRIDAQAARDGLDTITPPIPVAPCTDCTRHSGTLSGANDQDVQPDGTYYFSMPGTHSGWLKGPEQADFDLYLLKWTGFGWQTVAKSIETSSEAFVTYQGAIGFYAWIIHSHEGGGSYYVWLQRPAPTTPNTARQHSTNTP